MGRKFVREWMLISRTRNLKFHWDDRLKSCLDLSQKLPLLMQMFMWTLSNLKLLGQSAKVYAILILASGANYLYFFKKEPQRLKRQHSSRQMAIGFG